MTDSKSNIELIANKLGIDKQFIKEYKITEEIVYEISGKPIIKSDATTGEIFYENKKLEIPNKLTDEFLQTFHLKFEHCIFTQTISITDCDISQNITFQDCIFEKKSNFFSS